jgi:hypothetical protein
MQVILGAGIPILEEAKRKRRSRQVNESIFALSMPGM